MFSCQTSMPQTYSVSAIWIVQISILFIHPGQIQFLNMNCSNLNLGYLPFYPGQIQLLLFELFKIQFGLFTLDRFSFCYFNCSNLKLVYLPWTNSVSAIWIVQISIWFNIHPGQIQISIWFIYPGQIQLLLFGLFKFQFGLIFTLDKFKFQFGLSSLDKFSFCYLDWSNFNLVYLPWTNSAFAIWIVQISILLFGFLCILYCIQYLFVFLCFLLFFCDF